MIIPDFLLHDWAKGGGVKPFLPENINPASIDLWIGNRYIDLHSGQEFTAKDTIELLPGDAILATTMEYITMPFGWAGSVYLKSSLARQGLDHALAGWVDPGFHGELTLELHAHRQVILKVGQRVLQLVCFAMKEHPEKTYRETGRYNGQTGPTPAR